MIIDKLKAQDAVTLTAVIVTVIVILILAGVTLPLITGSDGILEKSKSSVSAYKEQSIREKVELEMASLNLEKLNTEARNANLDDIDELVGKDGITEVESISDKEIMIVIDGYQCIINQNLEVESINVYDASKKQLTKAKMSLTFCTIDREI